MQQKYFTVTGVNAKWSKSGHIPYYVFRKKMMSAPQITETQVLFSSTVEMYCLLRFVLWSMIGPHPGMTSNVLSGFQSDFGDVKRLFKDFNFLSEYRQNNHC